MRGTEGLGRASLRHLRMFQEAVARRSITAAAEVSHVSQSAVTQAVAGLEKSAGGPLFRRTPQGVFPTARGEALSARLTRAFGFLDPALEDISPRLKLTATAAQLSALAAMREAGNATLAARRLGLAQPTVHRAVSMLERESPRPLFERTAHGVVATRQARALAQAARLCFAEIAPAEAELAEMDGRDTGVLRIGALPLSRAGLLPRALARFRAARPGTGAEVHDGGYDALLGALRRGEIDVVIGALREPAPIGDVVQERLFDDRLAVLARPGHPLVGRRGIGAEALAAHPWAAPRAGSPARAQFDALFAALPGGAPSGVVETGSLLLMRELLLSSDHLGCISGGQAAGEVERGLLVALDIAADLPGRPIGLTFRASFAPTPAQAAFLDLLRAEAGAPVTPPAPAGSP